jgi:hypothetical protein
MLRPNTLTIKINAWSASIDQVDPTHMMSAISYCYTQLPLVGQAKNYMQLNELNLHFKISTIHVSFCTYWVFESQQHNDWKIISVCGMHVPVKWDIHSKLWLEIIKGKEHSGNSYRWEDNITTLERYTLWRTLIFYMWSEVIIALIWSNVIVRSWVILALMW